MTDSEWKEYRLGDVADVQWGDTSTTKSKYVSEGYTAYSASGPDGKLPYADFKNREGVVLSAIGANSGATWFASGNWSTIKNTIRFWSISENIDTKFLFYMLDKKRWPLRGSAQPFISLGDARDVRFRAPSIQEQRRIASILSSLDDKIELNNKINDNLEKQAQALFKNWFIDYAPFGGVMPEDWKEGTLSEIINVKYGKDHKKLADGLYPVYGSGGVMRYAEQFLYDKESVLIPRKGTLNNVFYINEPFWSVDTMFYTEMKIPNVAKFVYFFVKGKDLASLNAGSAVPSMTTEILNAMPIIIPSGHALECFEKIVAPMFREASERIDESRLLENMRNVLLTRLMAGTER